MNRHPAPRRPLRDPLSRLLGRAFRGFGSRLLRGVGRPLEDRGEAVRSLRLSRHGFGLSIHRYSLRSERGGDPDPALWAAEGSWAMDVPSPTLRRSPRAGLKTCSYNRWSRPGAAPPCLASFLRPPAASRATSTRFFPHHGRRESAAGPDEARLSKKDNSPFGDPAGSGRDGRDRRPRKHAGDPTASPSAQPYARVS